MEDRTETNNLANEYPEVVKELKKEYDLWAKKCGVIPWEEIIENHK